MGEKGLGFAFVTWDVCDNRLVGDELFARLYGFSDRQAREGVSIEEVLARIMPGDRERVAREVHTAILTGEPYATTFSIRAKKQPQKVVYLGRCLFDGEGFPSFFSGTLAPSDETMSPGSSTEALCLTALGQARTDQQELASQYLTSALKALSATLHH